VVVWITGILILIQIVTQSYLFKVDASPTASPDTRQAAQQALQNFQHFLDRTALAPGSLNVGLFSNWYRVISSSVLHYGWLHLLYNVWFFVLFGHVLEHLLGAKRFLLLFGFGLIVPPVLDGLIPVGLGGVQYTAGLSGVVYAFMGAALVLFPMARCYGAVNYDLRFWAAIFCILLPVSTVTRLAGMALTETVLILGVTAAFLLIQPEHSRISLPLGIVILIKLLQDLLLIQPAINDVVSNSFWRIGGGLIVGSVVAFSMGGARGWKKTWPDETQQLKAGRTGSNRGKTPMAKLESEGRRTLEGAQIFLGQRVFVGDAERASNFYSEVVMAKFPELVLPMQEQIALARLLQFKGREAEALHAYENLVNKISPIPDEHWIAWLKAAELSIKLHPDQPARARNYLTRFQQGNITMLRDRIEAERLESLLPAVETAPEPEPVLPELTESRPPASVPEQAPSVDFERVTPVTFKYVPGSAPVSLRQPSVAGRHEPTLADPEFLKTYWKPLPSLGERTIAPVLERRVKNSRFVEEEEKPSMYAGGKPMPNRGIRPQTRLGNVETFRNLPAPEAAKAEEMPGRYGGLADESEANLVIRLRSEPESGPLKPRQKRARSDVDGLFFGGAVSKTEPIEDFYRDAEPSNAKESQPSLRTGPEVVEVFGIVVSESGCHFKTAFGSRRVAWDEVVLVAIGRMKLTATSLAEPRLMLEIAAGGKRTYRYQVFERTLVLKGSSVNGAAAENAEKFLLSAWTFCKQNAKKAKLLPAQESVVPQYDGYSNYHSLVEPLLPPI